MLNAITALIIFILLILCITYCYKTNKNKNQEIHRQAKLMNAKRKPKYKKKSIVDEGMFEFKEDDKNRLHY